MGNLSFLHRVGNTIQSLITIAENLAVIVSFSYWLPNWSLRFAMWRLDTILYDNPRNESKV